MSDYIPPGPSKERNRFSNTSKPSISDIFDVQSEIIKWLPAKSLLRFRSVSTDWKTHIDTNHNRRLLVSYELDNVRRYALIGDDNNFPQQIIPLTAPESLSSLRKLLTLAADAGLICFYGDVDSNTKRAVIWNTTVGKSVGINVILKEEYMHTVVGFGVCSHDPMLVKIGVKANNDGRPTWWDVDVFSLSTREWRNVYEGAPFKSCKLECAKVCINGVIYFRAYDIPAPGRPTSNFFISFNLETGVFGEVPFPVDLVHTQKYIQAAKVNESLGILEYHLNDEGARGMHVCSVWTWEETFNMIYTVVVQGHSLYGDVLGFRNNGEVVVELRDGDNNEQSRIVVYEPFTRHIRGVGIYGRRRTFSARSFMETAHLLDQPEPDIIIH